MEWVFGLLIVVLPILYIFDIFTAFHWLGHSGLFYQMAVNILVAVAVLGIYLAMLLDDDPETLADENDKKIKDSKIGLLIMTLIEFLVIGYCCYNMYNIVLDLLHPPITETVTLKQVKDYGRRTTTEEIIFIENGERKSIDMPYSSFFDWAVGSVPKLTHIISFPKEAEITYYPNTDTVVDITIDK